MSRDDLRQAHGLQSEHRLETGSELRPAVPPNGIGAEEDSSRTWWRWWEAVLRSELGLSCSWTGVTGLTGPGCPSERNVDEGEDSEPGPRSAWK